uniref:Uncharacterized protein n=1 Tax=Glossina palpalis gambiensis TaxID=67801 RepID=A0A1B0C1J5_9MUSC
MARKDVPDLLAETINYKFKPKYRRQATGNQADAIFLNCPNVQFLIDDVSHPASETASSADSSYKEVTQNADGCNNEAFNKGSTHDINIFSVEPLLSSSGTNVEQSSALYRKFAENIQKSMGQAKVFLLKLHNVMLMIMTYMGPEIFTKTYNDGHGRAVNTLSVGCVVVEMASGKINKRPTSFFRIALSFSLSVTLGAI